MHDCAGRRAPSGETLTSIIYHELTAADVANAARNEDGLWLAEVGAVAASVAGIEPTWDSGRKRWYADVLLPGPAGRSYSPFVRLALARYQHFSTAADLKLSRVVALDFAQLIPDRTLRVVPPRRA